ncbi:MAG: hypothetical protein IJ882_02365, partial [Paludibacteraceae bacterium]|nr:hypothetical protein [Paludibacteraceae bacterium]
PSNQLYIEGLNGEQIPIKQARRYTRSEMMVMEMLSQNARNNWERPIYFAVTVGNDYYLGLEPYFELTGLAYRVTPTRSRDGQPRVNTEKMYENMMHQFKYGNLNIPGIYIDENLMRMCRTHRMMFMELAEALLREGKREQCREVLDYAEEMLPQCNVPYDYTSATMASFYYMLGSEEDIEKANRIMESVADTDVDYLAWGAQANKQTRSAMQSTLSHHRAVLGYVLQNLERYKQTELFEKYYPLYVQYASK